jgi:hypothetical protein
VWIEPFELVAYKLDRFVELESEILRSAPVNLNRHGLFLDKRMDRQNQRSRRTITTTWCLAAGVFTMLSPIAAVIPVT